MTEKRAYYDPAVQTMPLDRVRRLQVDRLARQLDRVWSVPMQISTIRPPQRGQVRTSTANVCRSSAAHDHARERGADDSCAAGAGA